MRGKTTAYVCEQQVCELPTSDPAVFAAQIAKVETATRDNRALSASDGPRPCNRHALRNRVSPNRRAFRYRLRSTRNRVPLARRLRSGL